MEVPLVRLDVLVTDEDGNVLSGLKSGNFRILDNEAVQTIESFTSTAAPITFLMTKEEGCTPPQKLEYKPGQPIEDVCASPVRGATEDQE